MSMGWFGSSGVLIPGPWIGLVTDPWGGMVPGPWGGMVPGPWGGMVPGPWEMPHSFSLVSQCCS